MIDQGHIQEAGERTGSPFAAVIAEYRRHAAKVASRPSKSERQTERRARAAFYYNSVAAQLETL